jgi:hypothetical protein
MVENKTENLVVRVEPSVADRLAEWASDHNMRVSTAIRHFIGLGLAADDYTANLAAQNAERHARLLAAVNTEPK